MNFYSKKVILLFLLPSFIGIVVFKIVSMLVAVGISFTDWNLLGAPDFVGLSNYKRILHDQNIHLALKNTFYFIIGYIPFVIAIGLGLACLLNRALKGVFVFRGIFFLSVIASWVAVSVIFKGLFNTELGLINQIFNFFGLTGPGWLQDPNFTMKAIVTASVWKDAGFIAVIFLGGLQSISKDVYEAAKLDGIKPSQQFRYITLPLLSPTLFYALMISVISSFQVFDQVNIMTANEPSAQLLPVMVTEIYKHSFRYMDMGYATALSFMLFVIILLVTFVMNKLQAKWVTYES